MTKKNKLQQQNTAIGTKLQYNTEQQYTSIQHNTTSTEKQYRTSKNTINLHRMNT